MGKQVRKNKVKIRGNQQLPGKKGAAVNFITRNQALKKLQLTLPQFRKLCILKGVYPREPKKAPRGKDKTYYFKKDILYLEHDILISKMAEQRIWKKKLKTAKDKKNKSQEEEDGDTDGEADADPDTDGDAVGKESNEGDKAKDNGDNEKGKLSEQTDEALFGDLTKQEKELNVYENLFAKSHFWLSREVPKESLEFVIRSFGGKVSWEYSGDEKDESITHTVVDRDWPTERIVSRDYIQPQWVYDCINARVLIPTGEYGAGAKLPPHLSPFVDDYAEGYIPEYRKKLEGYYKQVHGIPVDIPVNPVVIDDESESDEEQRFAQDLAAEKEGNYQDTPKKEKSEKTGKDKNKRKKRQNEIDEEEQKVTAESLLPQKKRRLLQTIKYSRRLKQRVIEKLEEKKQKLQDGTAQVVGKDTLVYSDPQ